MTTIDFTKEMNAAKVKVLENGMLISIQLGSQNQQMEYPQVKSLTKNYILQNLRRFRNSLNDVSDPDIPELDEFAGGLTRKEMYFILRSVYMEIVAKENKAEVVKLEEEMGKFKTRKEQKDAIQAKIDALKKG